MDTVKNRYYFSMSTMGFSNTLRCRDCNDTALVVYPGSLSVDVDLERLADVTQKHDKDVHSERTVFKVYGTQSSGIESPRMNLKVHKLENCEGEFCVIHKPSTHHMRFWPIMFDPAQYFTAYRMCNHGEYHPDPDSIAHGISIGVMKADSHKNCCGCCKDDM